PDSLVHSDPTEPTADTLRAEHQLDDLERVLAPGTKLGSHYTVLRKLGAGGMGLVLLARDERLMREVAVKFVSPGLLTEADSQHRFLEEARAMARVRHPNVVEVFAFDEHEGRPYFVMEYVPGITADTWFRERMLGGTPPPVDEVLGIIEQCCRGASAIHQSGLIHGDLKPQNVLLGPSFRVALADLGLAQMLEWAPAGEVAGTPAYMAPESSVGADPALLRRRDVYSLGVMTYQFLTGQQPYRVRRVPGAHALLREGRALPVSQLREELPQAFDGVLERALALEPAQRLDSADTLRRELMRARRAASERKFAARILAVDDDADFLALVDRSLRAALPGVQVVCVPDGGRALDQLSQRPFDLVLLDLRLPDYNGVELTATIRAEERGRRTPILVVTGYGGGRDWQLLSSLGADGFLVKPVDPHALSAMVGRMLAPAQPAP
ncbi:MAG TPA: protein kinase, partial [Polyangiales bacterium]